MPTIDELRKEKARLMAKRNSDRGGLVDGVRNELLNMADCINLYNRVYSKTELLETFQRWAEDLEHANRCEDDYENFWKEDDADDEEDE